MEEFIAAVFAVVLLGLSSLGIVFVAAGTLDDTVIRHCRDQGYWQTGQTRVICSPEKVPEKSPKAP